MALRAKVTVSAAGASAAIPVDWLQSNFKVGFAVEVNGTLTYSVQATLDDIQDTAITPVWFDHPSASGKTVAVLDGFDRPVRAVRLNVTAFTAGSATLRALQGNL